MRNGLLDVPDRLHRLGLLARLDAERRAIDEQDARTLEENRGRIHAALGRLRQSASTDELITRAPRELRRACGFTRVMISRAEGTRWIPDTLTAADGADPEAEEFRRFAEGDIEIPLAHLLLETEMARHRVPLSLAANVLARYGDPDVVGSWLKGLIAGDVIPAIALTEPGGGSDAANNLIVRARREGNEYVLDGEKTSTTFATQAGFAVVWARSGPPDSGARGISAFLVPLDIPGITTSEFEDIGGRSAGRGALVLDDVRIPASHLLGEEGRGFVQVMQGFDYSRALIGLQCLAVANQSLEETWVSTRERRSFGKPLAAHQGVSFPLAEAETHVRACRLLCLQTLWLKDQGLPHTAEAAMCKWWGPKLAFEVVQTCLLLHGHGGYSTELPYEQRLRDVLGLQIGDGTAQIMKLVIAREKAGRDAVSA